VKGWTPLAFHGYCALEQMLSVLLFALLLSLPTTVFSSSSLSLLHESASRISTCSFYVPFLNMCAIVLFRELYFSTSFH
jgi:hypothetical protein